MRVRTAHAAWPALCLLTTACAPEPQQVTGNFNPTPVKQVKAEANRPQCGGAPKSVTFEVKIKLSIIPADAKVNAAGQLQITGEHASDFRFEGTMLRLIPNDQDVTIRLVFEPREVGPRFATVVLNLPVGTNPAGKIVVHLVGLATCQNANPAIGDGDGDGLTDKDDRDAAGNTGAVPANDPDQDQDGIPDGREDKNGNGALDPKIETDPHKKDTDGDELDDGAEDINKNGNVDDPERDPKDPNR